MNAVRNAYWTAMARLWRAAERVTARLRHFCWLRRARAEEAALDSMSAAQVEARLRAIDERFDALQRGGEG